MLTLPSPTIRMTLSTPRLRFSTCSSTNPDHFTVGSHRTSKCDFDNGGADDQCGFDMYGPNYVNFEAYWYNVFSMLRHRAQVRFGVWQGNTIACQAVQKISHGNVERWLKVPAHDPSPCIF